MSYYTNKSKILKTHNLSYESYYDRFLVRYCTTSGYYGQVKGPLAMMEDWSMFDNKGIVMGIDQSTSCTGICIAKLTKKKGTVPMLFIDIINNDIPSKDMYIGMFFEWLCFNLSHINPQIVVYEKVAQNAVQTRSRVLLGLMVEQITRICNRTGFMTDEIMPAVWRKHLLQSKEYTGLKGRRDTAKACCLKETLKRYPDMEKYLTKAVHSNIYAELDSVDSIDAFGIINGYMLENYVDGDIRKPRVNSTWPNYPLSTYKVSYIEHAEFEILKAENTADGIFSMPLIMLNSKNAIEDNYRRVINHTDKKCILYTDDVKTLQALRIASNKPDAKQLFVVIERKE